jgi:Glyoxalase-like domain
MCGTPAIVAGTRYGVQRPVRLDEDMTAIARLGAVSLDAAEPAVVAGFYRELLGLETYFESPDFVALKGAAVLLTVQRVADHREPDWPTGPVPKQVHLELAGDDLDEAEKAALEVGARKAAVQPAPDRFRVLIDPAGHPFCLSVLIPEV